MKILCLHGHGSNPEILKYQMSGLFKNTDPSWEFDFIMGEVPCSPSPGAEAFMGPYHCYNRKFDWENEALAHEALDEKILDDGPFNGVFAFSQGAAVITSYLIGKKTKEPTKPLPFGFVILCSSTIPLTGDLTYLQQVYGGMSTIDQSRIRSCNDTEIAQICHPAREALQVLVQTLDATQDTTKQNRGFFLDRPIEEIPCVLHPQFCHTHLPIASLIVRGRNESPAIRACAEVVKSFFDQRKQQFFEHAGGHDVPRSGLELQKLVSAMERVVFQSQLPT